MIDIRGYHNVPQTFMEKDNSSSLLRTTVVVESIQINIHPKGYLKMRRNNSRAIESRQSN
jgi:hypothetical protein